MTTPDLARRLAVARDFDMLQGLGWAAFGSGLALAAAFDTKALLWAGVLACSLLFAWYRSRYGSVEASCGRSWAAAGIALAVALLVVVGFAADDAAAGPVLWTPLLGALGLVVGQWFGLRHVGLTAVHRSVCVLLAACALVPLAGWRPAPVQGLVPVGLALVVTGLVDHARLVRVLGRGGRRRD